MELENQFCKSTSKEFSANDVEECVTEYTYRYGSWKEKSRKRGPERKEDSRREREIIEE
jgi:hypothetical protein